MMLPTVRAVLLGEIEDLFEAAANGEIEESGDDYEALKPIVSDPEIYVTALETRRRRSRLTPRASPDRQLFS